MAIEYGTIFNLTSINFLGNKNLLFIFFILSASSLSFLAAGWASFSKYLSMGGTRGANQVLGYELIMSFILLILVFLNRGLSLESFLINQSLPGLFFVMHIDLFVIFWPSILIAVNNFSFTNYFQDILIYTSTPIVVAYFSSDVLVDPLLNSIESFSINFTELNNRIFSQTSWVSSFVSDCKMYDKK